MTFDNESFTDCWIYLTQWGIHTAADTDTDTDTDMFLKHTVFNGSIHTATDTNTDVGGCHR